jgi:predicted hydrocarbon binding protein
MSGDEEVNQLLGSLGYDAERGALSLSNARYVMLSPSLFVELQKNVEQYLPQQVAEIMTSTAEGDGAFLASRYRDVFGYPPDQVLTAVSYMLSESGWGAMSVEMAHFEGEELVFKVLDSPFAEVYGPSTQPVCYTILGVLRGVAMTLFDKPAGGAEVQCAAKGDSCCRFVVSGNPG